jgi:hypothetical protein
MPLNRSLSRFNWRGPDWQVYSESMSTAERRPLALILLRWLGRIGAVLVFLFWGAFFIEHLMEWFVKPFPNLPPVKVCLGQLLHFLMLVGLLVALRWPQVGTPVVVVAAGIFLVRTGANFPFFLAGTILPVLVLLGCWWAGRRATPMPPVIS